jgi:hypothetical protein
MLHRGFAALGLFAISPAHATLIDSLDMSGSQLWADHVVTADGEELFIGDAPLLTYSPASWSLATTGDRNAINSYIVDGIQVFLHEWFCGPVRDSELRISDAAWGYEGLEGSFNNGQMSSPTSVPEPATLSLLAAGALGVFVARRRKQATDAK